MCSCDLKYIFDRCYAWLYWGVKEFSNTKWKSCAGNSKAVAAYVSASSESALHSPVGGKSDVHTLNWKTSFREGVPETHMVL